MVNATPGILIECDATIKQFLLHLDETLHFILADLDEHHLLVDDKNVDELQRKLDELLDENAYTFVR
jgi:TFIIH basal transcription factor complex TTD-A subunit